MKAEGIFWQLLKFFSLALRELIPLVLIVYLLKFLVYYYENSAQSLTIQKKFNARNLNMFY